MLSGTDKKYRRSSIEVQQQFIWKQKQNIENIKLLKETAANHSIVTEHDDKPSNEMKAKLLASKLTARKLKVTGGFSVSNNFEKSSSIIQSSIQKPSSPISNQGTPFKYEFKNNEVEILLQEKQHWLTRMHEDNIKMARVLEDLKKTKQKVTNKLYELNYERNKLRSILTADGQVYSVDSIEAFLEDSMISRAKQSHFIPPNRSLEANQLLQELLILSAGLKANQSEVNEFFMSTLQHTIDDFVSEANTTEDGESRLYHKPLKVLRALASTGPGNINAAQKLANAVAETLITAVCDQTERLNANLQKKNSSKNIQELLIENEALKLKLSQERKKNAAMRSKLSAITSNNSEISKTPGALSNTIQKVVTDSEEDLVNEELDESKDESKIDEGGPGKLFLESILLDKYDIFDKYLFQTLLKQAGNICLEHKLAVASSNKLDKETEEIVQSFIVNDVIESARLALASYIQNELDISTLRVDEVNTVADVDQLGHWFGDAVNHISKSSFVISKLFALSTFYLTYLHTSNAAAGSDQPQSNEVKNDSSTEALNTLNILSSNKIISTAENKTFEQSLAEGEINNIPAYHRSQSQRTNTPSTSSSKPSLKPRYMMPRQGSPSPRSKSYM